MNYGSQVNLVDINSLVSYNSITLLNKHGNINMNIEHSPASVVIANTEENWDLLTTSPYHFYVPPEWETVSEMLVCFESVECKTNALEYMAGSSKLYHN